MTFEEIKKHVRDMNIHVDQLYTEDDLKKDRTFGKIFDDLANANKKITDLEEEHNAKLGEKDEEIKKLTKDMTMVTAESKLEKVIDSYEIEGKKLTDLQKSFVKLQFKPSTLEDLDDEKISDFINKSVNEEFPKYSQAGIVGDKDDKPDVDMSGDDDDNLDEIDKIVKDVVTKQPQGV